MGGLFGKVSNTKGLQIMKTKNRINMYFGTKDHWSDGVVPHAKRIANPILYWMEKDPEAQKPPTKKKPKAEKWIQLELFPSEKKKSSST
jgi:hypothetical protein